MVSHSRLLRRALLLCSLLTLSGLHESGQQSVPWRVCRLLSPALCLTSAIASTARSLLAAGGAELLLSLLLTVVACHALLVQTLLLRRRRRVHVLLRRLEALEAATAPCQSPGDSASIRRQSALLGALLVSDTAVWLVSFFASGELAPPRYLIPWAVPAALSGPHWYSVVVGVQVVTAVVVLTVHVSLDMTLTAFADGLAVVQLRLGRYCREHVSDGGQQKLTVLGEEDGDSAEDPDACDAGLDGRSARTDTDAPPVKLCWTSQLRLRISPHSASPPPSREPSASGPRAAALTARRLEHFTSVYSAVRRLCAEAAALCSAPALSLHASVVGGLLLGGYLGTAAAPAGTLSVNPSTHVVFLGSLVVRLGVVSCAGSRLLQAGRRLHEALAAVRWSAHVPAAARLQLLQLLERSRQPPALDAWGLFTIQKGTVLSLFSFVLTYYVILLQMKVG